MSGTRLTAPMKPWGIIAVAMVATTIIGSMLQASIESLRNEVLAANFQMERRIMDRLEGCSGRFRGYCPRTESLGAKQR